MIDATTLTIIITTLGASLTSVAVGLLQFAREGRQHRWQVEQSDRDADERRVVAAELKAKVAEQAALVAAQTSHGQLQLADKIDANTEISKAAFREANNVNAKIAAIGAVRMTDSSQQQRDRIEAVGKDTNAVVHDLAATVAEK